MQFVLCFVTFRMLNCSVLMLKVWQNNAAISCLVLINHFGLAGFFGISSYMNIFSGLILGLTNTSLFCWRSDHQLIKSISFRNVRLFTWLDPKFHFNADLNLTYICILYIAMKLPDFSYFNLFHLIWAKVKFCKSILFILFGLNFLRVCVFEGEILRTWLAMFAIF